MYMLINDREKSVVMTESFIEFKEFVLRYLFENKSDIILDERLYKIYYEIISDIFDAEDSEAMRCCLNAVNVYFDKRMWVK